MPYWDRAKLNSVLSDAELIQLTDDDGVGSVQEARVTEAGNFADGLIEGSLIAGGYALPLNPVPTVLASIAHTLMSYWLHKRRLKTALPESLEKDYQNQMNLLKKVSSGEIMLGVAAALPSRITLHDLYEEE